MVIHEQSVFFPPISEKSRERSIMSVNMAPTRKRNVSSVLNLKRAKNDVNCIVERLLESRKHANDVFDIFEFLQVKKKKHPSFNWVYV